MNILNNFSIFFIYLDYTSILFLLGICGILINRRNILLMLLSFELTFFSSSLNFIIASSFLNNVFGSVYGIFVIIIVVADTAIALSLIVLVYRNAKSVSINYLITLRG